MSTASSGLSYHRVERRTGTTGSWSTVSSTVGGSSTSYTVTGLSHSTTYYFRVSAYGDGTTYAAEWSTASSTDSATTDVPRPSTPRNLSSTAGDGTIKLTWTPVSGARSYVVYQWNGVSWPALKPNDPNSAYPISFSGSSATIEGLTNGTAYSHRVASKNRGGQSSGAQISTSLPLLAPSELDVTPLPLRKARLAYTFPTNNPSDTQYKVEFQVQGGTWATQSTHTQDGSVGSLEIDLDNIMGAESDGLAENDGYEIRIKTTSGTNSVYSDEITIIDSPILSINGDSSKVEGPDRQTIGKAAVTWEQQAGATSYTLRWRKLGLDGNGNSHTSDEWELDGSSLPLTFDDDDKEEGIASSDTEHLIRLLDLREVYAVQLNYQTADGWVFSARDTYVWPAASKPGSPSGVNHPDSGERVAGYPFFGHFDPKVFKYRVCEDTFYPDDETKQEEWVALIVHAVEQWDTATNGFIKITPEYKPPEEWEKTGEPDFEECTEPPSAYELLLARVPIQIPFLDLDEEAAEEVSERFAEDNRRSEIRMLGLGIAKIASVGEMLLDPFKLCLLDAPACTTSVTGYFQGTRQASNILPSADISFNQDKLDAARDDDGVHIKKPDSVSFNACIEGNTAHQNDSSNTNDFYAYTLALHEAGHALGLSDWTATWTEAFLAVSLFNTVVDVLSKVSLVPEEFKLEGVESYSKEEIYKASHPSTPGSVTNYDGPAGVNEPDCFPYPLDVMAIYALYQTD